MAEHWSSAIIQRLEREGFFGSLELKFRDGALVLITKTETIRPPAETNAKNAKEVTHA